MTEKQAQKHLTAHMLERRGGLLIASNVYFFHPKVESDLLVVTYQDELIEVEIKVSKWDYLNDFKKVDRHEALKTRHHFHRIPNLFYFAVPEDMKDKIEVPDYAGLYIITSKGACRCVKKAPRLHNEKMDPKRWKDLAIKLYHKL